jgi:hypothetical protein
MSTEAPRFYYSTAGYICDKERYREPTTKLARLKDVPLWRESGRLICDELITSPDKVAEILEAWKTHLEHMIPPIRTVAAFKASVEAWEAAMLVATSSEDQEEAKRATEVCIREERRQDEARHLFEFDDEGATVATEQLGAGKPHDRRPGQEAGRDHTRDDGSGGH